MNGKAISDEERTLAAFVDVVFDDRDFVDMEFEAIIADSWRERRGTTTLQRYDRGDSRWAGIRLLTSPRAGWPPPLESWSTIRSPPALSRSCDPE